MFQPKLPNNALTRSTIKNDVVDILLASIATEEPGLPHMVNTEEEIIRDSFVNVPGLSPASTLKDISEGNSSAQDTLAITIKKELLRCLK